MGFSVPIEPSEADEISDGAALITTRPFELRMGMGPGYPSTSLEVTAATRLSVIRTTRAADCVPPIQYASVWVTVLDGAAAGTEAWVSCANLPDPVNVPERLRALGVEPVDARR